MSLSSTVAWSDHKAFLLSGIRNLFESGRLSDLEIRCKERVFRVHKTILGIFTDYFRHCDGLWANIDVDSQLMENVLKFLYHGQVVIDYDQMEGFLGTCKFLGIRLFKGPEINAEGMDEDEAAQCYQERYELNDFQLMCHHCYKCFPNEKLMKKHNWNCGRQQVMFKCKTCEKIFGFKVELKNHEIVHTSGTPFRCPRENCSRTFALKSEVWAHVVDDHDQFRYRCAAPCDARFKYARELADHNAQLHGQDAQQAFPCKECKEFFSSKLLLRMHKKKKGHWTRPARVGGAKNRRGDDTACSTLKEEGPELNETTDVSLVANDNCAQ